MQTVGRSAAAHGWAVSVALERTPETESLAVDLEADPQIELIDAPLRIDRRGNAFRQGLATMWLALRLRPDAALAVLPWPTFGLGTMVALGVLTVPSAIVFQLAPWPEPAGSWAAACRWARTRRQAWIAVSEQNAGAIARTFKIESGDVRTIYNGGPNPVDRPPGIRAQTRARTRQSLGIAPEATLAMTVGRLSEQKGQDLLLEALPRIVAARPDAMFVCVGEGPLRSRLVADIQRRALTANVRLAGHRADVGDLLDGADLFVLPSRYEGMPFALLEAMARGIPVVTAAVGGCDEVVRDGVDGLVHRPADPVDLGDKLLWALDHPQTMGEMAESARERAREFTETQMLEATLGVLDDLLSPS